MFRGRICGVFQAKGHGVFDCQAGHVVSIPVDGLQRRVQNQNNLHLFVMTNPDRRKGDLAIPAAIPATGRLRPACFSPAVEPASFTAWRRLASCWIDRAFRSVHCARSVFVCACLPGSDGSPAGGVNFSDDRMTGSNLANARQPVKIGSDRAVYPVHFPLRCLIEIHGHSSEVQLR